MSLHSAVSPAAILQRMAAQKRVKLGWVDDARGAATPWFVDCLDIHDETLLDPVIAAASDPRSSPADAASAGSWRSPGYRQ